MKINRLLEMTIILMNRGSATARELADRFGVSVRTIYRDIDDLSGAGVPVYTTKGINGGIHLMEDYALNKAIVNEHEADSLILALKTMQATRFPDLDVTLSKLGALFKRNTRSDWVHIEFSPWGSEPNEENKFIDIKVAILNRKVISFDYLNSQGEKGNRSAEPLQLMYKGNAWYLWAWCRNKEAFRLFRISRMKNLRVTDITFSIRHTSASAETAEGPAESEERNSQAGDGTVSKPNAPQTIKALLRFRPEAMYRVYDDYNEGNIKRNDDGTCDVTAEFTEGEWVFGYILSFGSYVQVLQPESLRKAVAERLAEAMRYYL